MKKIIILYILLLGLPTPCFADDLNSRVLIPAGVAIVGTDLNDLKGQLQDKRAKVEWYMDEAPKKKVNVGSFMIDVTEVTNNRYKKFKPDHMYPPNLENHPVANVTWQEANEFCRKTGGRLPTEAEWERAARGDEGLIYPWGNEFNQENAVFLGTEGAAGSKMKVGSYSQEESGATLLGGTKPVGSIKNGKSPFGVYDMAGNVWEWLDGWYDEKKMRLLKGGSWLSPASSIRASVRLGDTGNGRFNDYGFRCSYNLD